MAILTTVLLLLLVGGAVLFVHEYGHYWFMRRYGVNVLEFAIGIGPALWTRVLASGTKFVIRPLWLFGYALPQNDDGPGSLHVATMRQKLWIYAGGMLFNVTCAFVVYAVLFHTVARPPDLISAFLRYRVEVPSALVPLAAAFVMSFGLWVLTPPIMAWLMFKGMFIAAMFGPVGLLQGSLASMLKADPAVAALFMFANLSVAAAGFNLLPIAGLDGQKLLETVLLKLFPDREDHIDHGLRLLTVLAVVLSGAVLAGEVALRSAR